MSVPELTQLANITHALGWTLVHFIWQGALICGLYFLSNMILNRRSANARYLAGLIALFVTAVAPVVTFSLVISGIGMPSSGIQLIAEAGIVTAGEASLLDVIKHSINSVLPAIVIIWSIGVTVLSLRALLGWRMAQGLCQTGVYALSEDIQNAVLRLAREFRISRPVRALESICVEVPTVVGWVTPVILLPAAVVTRMERRQLEMVIAHELGHIRRYDYLVNLFQIVVETVLFYHPAIRWMSKRIRQERENCCDDLVIRTCGEAVVYAKALANLEGLRRGLPEPAVPATGGDLLARVKRIASGGASDNRSSRSVLVATVMVAVLAALGARADLVRSHSQPGDPSWNAVLSTEDDSLLEFVAARGNWQRGLAGWSGIEIPPPEPAKKPVTETKVISAPTRLAADTTTKLQAQASPASETPVAGAAIAKTTQYTDMAQFTDLAQYTDIMYQPSDLVLESMGNSSTDFMAYEAEFAPAKDDYTVEENSEPEQETDAAAEIVKIHPLETVNPRYPYKARRKGIEGFVKLKFGVTEHGRVQDVTVVDAYPPKVFDKAAKRALRAWRFEVPAELGDSPMRLVQSFDFNLEDVEIDKQSRTDQRSACLSTGSRICQRYGPNIEVVYVNPPESVKSM